MANTNFSADWVDLNDKSVLITGGTGSFGKAFTKTVLKHFKPRRLIIFSRDELKQYEMQTEHSFAQYPCLRYFIGDVRDVGRLEMAMDGVDYVVHAAALKHVPAAEYNPFECVQTNIIGAENVVRAAMRNKVKGVIALSTDKAANPANLYGATKLASDKIFIAANNMSGHSGTNFAVVRYGNVLGSRGSVIPFFRRLLAEGARSLPVTDPRMTRFFITLDQGVGFVLSALSMMAAGEIFVPKIPSMRITDLAAAVAPDLPVEVVGIRPGEKLHEVMITEDDARNTVDLGDRYVILPNLAFCGRSGDYLARATAVPDDFRYASDSNSWWMGAADLQAMLGDIS